MKVDLTPTQVRILAEMIDDRIMGLVETIAWADREGPRNIDPRDSVLVRQARRELPIITDAANRLARK